MIDFLYGGSRTNNASVRYVDGKVELTQEQEAAIADVVEQFIQEYSTYGSNALIAKYGNFINNIFKDPQEARSITAEFLLNSYLMYNTMSDIYLQKVLPALQMILMEELHLCHVTLRMARCTR